MTTILITRHFSGFANVADHFSVGNNENEGSATLTEYSLPAGYCVAGATIYDPAGIECAIVPGDDNRPTLSSRMGNCPDAILPEA